MSWELADYKKEVSIVGKIKEKRKKEIRYGRGIV